MFKTLRAGFLKLESKLIENWTSAFRFWSIRLGLLGTAVAGVFAASPDAAFYAWSMLPADLKSYIPPQYTQFLGVFLFASSMVARVFKQNKLSTQVVNKIEVTPSPIPNAEPTVNVEVATVDAPPADDAR